MAATQIYAVEGSSFAIAATTVTGTAGVELFCETEEQAALLGGGGGGCSRVYAPDGQIISNLLDEHTEGIVYAEIDLSLIPLSKAAADPSGHYSRPDVTRLLLDKRPQPAVEVIGANDELPSAGLAGQSSVDLEDQSQPNSTDTGRNS